MATESRRRAKLFDSVIVGTEQEAEEFITNILEASTEYSIMGKDLNGKILLWNEGARRIYGTTRRRWWESLLFYPIHPGGRTSRQAA